MRELFRDSEHLLRMAGLFVVGTTAFLALRAFMIPHDFGVYGHYRAGALDDNRDQPLLFAGQEACRECHDYVFEERAAGAHAGVACESCHGALAAHVAEPAGEMEPPSSDLCAGCHETNSSKPSWFPQVVAATHSEGEACSECHAPHSPGFE